MSAISVTIRTLFRFFLTLHLARQKLHAKSRFRVHGSGSQKTAFHSTAITSNRRRSRSRTTGVVTVTDAVTVTVTVTVDVAAVVAVALTCVNPAVDVAGA